jgi:hypothetical protein
LQVTDLEHRLQVKEEKMVSLVETMQEMEERLEQLTADAEKSAALSDSTLPEDKVRKIILNEH